MRRILFIFVCFIYLVKGQDFYGELSCPHCGINKMDEEFLRELKLLENESSFKFEITSGYRCEIYNAKLDNSSPSSRHIDGLAVDIVPYNKSNVEEVGKLAEQSGYFTRVYDEHNHIHIDYGRNDDDFAFRVLSKRYTDYEEDLDLQNSFYIGRGIKYNSSQFTRIGYFLTDGDEVDNFYLYFDKLSENNLGSLGLAYNLYGYFGEYWGVGISVGQGKLNNAKYSILEPNFIIGCISQYVDLQFNLGYVLTKPDDINTSNQNIDGWQYGVTASIGIFKQ